MNKKTRKVFPRGRWAAVIVALVGCLILGQFSAAQTTSTIEGAVTDKQGLAVSGAEVHAEGSTAAESRTVLTDARGFYQIAGLPAGIYKLTVTRRGFSARIFDRLELTLNRTLTFDVKLEVGEVQERLPGREGQVGLRLIF